MGKGGRSGDAAPLRTGPAPDPAGITLANVARQLTLDGPEGDRTFIFKLYLPDPGKPSRYVISTEPFELDEDVWQPRARKLVNHWSGEDRGRVLFCVDRIDDVVIAAVAFHYDGPTKPLLVLAIADRTDAHWFASESAVHAVKRCLHLISLVLKGPGSVLYDAPGGEQHIRARDLYEFVDAEHGLTGRPGGKLMIQPPPADATTTSSDPR